MEIAEIRRVLVLGAGHMGNEIAVQCAAGGFEVVLQDISPERLAAGAESRARLLAGLVAEGRLATSDAAAIEGRITPVTDDRLAGQVDLVSESAPEQLKLKREIFARLHAVCPPHTLFTTNTSYLTTTQIAGHTGRPERFAALHFHAPVAGTSLVDIMPHAGTDPAVIAALRQFALRIGQVPLVYREPQEGYVFNTLLRQVTQTALTLAQGGVASFEDIDRAWMSVFNTASGPFGAIDEIGVDTVHSILEFWGGVLGDRQAQAAAAFLAPYITQGRLGAKVGRGLYDYPDAAFRRDDFLCPDLAATPLHPTMRRLLETARRPLLPASRSQRLPPGASDTTNAPEEPGRCILRSRPAPVHGKLQHPLRLAGACLLVGDNPTAQALSQLLAGRGAEVVSLPLTGSLDEILARHRDLWSRRPLTHLFLLTARDEAASTRCDAPEWAGRFEHGVLTPYFVCQAWYAQALERGLLPSASVVAATSLGGDFGVSEPVEAVEGGGLTGLLKALFLESAGRSPLGPQVKVVDAPLAQPPDETAELLCRELALAQASVVTGSLDETRRRYADVEVCSVRGGRRQVLVERAPLPGAASSASPAAEVRAALRDSVWVATGAARGITEYVARGLAERYQLRMHLVGSTPLPDEDLTTASEAELAERRARIHDDARRAGRDPDAVAIRWERSVAVQRTLAAWASAGLRATYHCCDVSRREPLAEVFARVRRQAGPVAGLLHGAGLEQVGWFAEKDPAAVRATLAVKALGMAHLLALTRDDPLKWCVGFGSLSGRFGNNRQTDYAMANDLLAKQIAWLRGARPDCHSVTFHWPGWSEVGMAARPASKAGLERINHHFISPAAGLAHVVRELEQGALSPEVAVIHRQEIPAEMRLEGPGPQPR